MNTMATAAIKTEKSTRKNQDLAERQEITEKHVRKPVAIKPSVNVVRSLIDQQNDKAKQEIKEQKELLDKQKQEQE